MARARREWRAWRWLLIWEIAEGLDLRRGAVRPDAGGGKEKAMPRPGQTLVGSGRKKRRMTSRWGGYFTPLRQGATKTRAR
jgi:hypothetical protein